MGTFLIAMGLGEIVGCVFWAYCGTKIMTWVKGEVAVANDYRMKATTIENSLRAKI